ncbi:MAG: RNA-binding S4 domain-containing protein [Xanthomonadaceae bacterium]|nr:RNA-binding S4 domain-containing protein [Xanthomonadaceae bacterium]
MAAEPVGAVRADLWLWAARFFRTRALAKQAIAGGKVGVNGGPCKPAKTLHVGDRLEVSRGEERFEIEVLQLAEQRGPASVAQTLYRESDESRTAREVAREQRRLAGAVPAPSSRPDKQARRELMRLKARN